MSVLDIQQISVCGAIVEIGSSSISDGGYALTLNVVIKNASNHADAEVACMLKTPRYYEGQVVQDNNGAVLIAIPKRYRKTVDITELGGDSWSASIEYEARCSPNDFELSFGTSGGQAHITQSLQTNAVAGVVRRDKDNNVLPFPNFQGAIGVTHDDIEGHDVIASSPEFSISKCYNPGFITTSVFAALVQLTAKINSIGWKGFGSRNVLFIGADGQSVQLGNDTINFHFRAEPNLTNIPIGNRYTVPFKAGHDVMWTRYEDEVDTLAGFKIKLPSVSYVEQVYQAVDYNYAFSLFGF